MLVYIVVAALPDNSDLDRDRMNTVEDLPDDMARALIDNGTGREPAEDEAAEWRKAHPKEGGNVEPGQGVPGEPGPDEAEPVKLDPRAPGGVRMRARNHVAQDEDSDAQPTETDQQAQ